MARHTHGAYGGAVRIELRRPAGLALLAAALLLTAGCGPTAVLTDESPAQAVQAALEAAQTTPLTMSLAGSLTLQSSSLQNLPASIQSALGQLGSGGSATAQLTQESSARRELQVSAAGHSADLVEYDGHGYVSVDGGGYAELSESLPTDLVVSQSVLDSAVAGLGFQDQGPTTSGGQPVEHYSAALTLSALETLVENLASSTGEGSEVQMAFALLAPYVTLSDSSVDVYLSTADGSLVRLSLSTSIAVNVGAICSALAGLGAAGGAAGSLPSGSISVGVSLNAQVSNYGGAVTVTQPTATSTLPASASGSLVTGVSLPAI